MSALPRFELLSAPENACPVCPLHPLESAARRRWLAASAKSPATRKSYIFALSLFLSASGAFSVLDLCRDRESALRALTALQMALAGQAVSTVRVRLAAVKSLLRSLEADDLIPPVSHNIIAPSVALKGQRVDGVVLPVEVPGEDLCLECIAAEPVPRNQLILRMLHFCGLRSAELLGLRWSHVVTIRGVVCIVVIRKGGKQQEIGLRPELAEQLAEWRGMCKGELVFDLNPKSLYKICRRAWGRVGVTPENWPGLRKGEGGPGLGAHSRRHAHATARLEAGADPLDVQDGMGHQSLKTTLGYVHRAPAIAGADLRWG